MIRFTTLFALATFATPVAFADAPPECTTPCPAGPTVTSGANSAEAVQADVQSLTSEIRRLKARVRTLERTPATATDLSEIEARLAYLEVALAGLNLEAVQAELAEHSARLDSIETRLRALEDTVGRQQVQLDEHDEILRRLEAAGSVDMPRVVTFATSVGASGFAANGHDVVNGDDMIFHASPSAGGAFDLSVGVLVRPKEVPMYFGASVAPRLSFDEGYGGSLIGRIGGTLGPAKGMELGLLGGVDFFYDPNLQAPDWMPDPERSSWRGVIGGEFNYLFWRSDAGQEVGLGVETSVLPGREIEGRVLGALKVRF